MTANVVEPIVARIPPRLARAARNVLDNPNSPYRDMSDLVSAALDALFGLLDPAYLPIDLDATGTVECGPAVVDPSVASGLLERDPAPKPDREPPGLARLVRRSEDVNAVAVVEETRSGGPLFVLTNRLNPFAIASRILMNMTLDGGAPTVTEFSQAGSACAREVGLRLREEDRKRNRRGGEKRAVAWPIGEDEKKSRDRFAWSFLLWPTPDGGSFGPLAEMGLATVTEGRAMLTERGATLATVPSALLGEARGWTLSPEEQATLRAALTGLSGEMEEVVFFLEAIRAAKGAQPRVERALMKKHESWSPNRVTAHRAAMIGRLRDIDVISVSGSGPSAVIEIKAFGAELLRDDATEEAAG